MRGRVLIAEDEPSLRTCIATFLRAEDFEVQTVDCAASAIAALDNDQFDVVITDMAMETETSGYEVVRAAQCQKYEPEVVVFTCFHIAPAEWKKRGIKKLFTKGDVEISDVSRAINRICDERVRVALRCQPACIKASGSSKIDSPPP